MRLALNRFSRFRASASRGLPELAGSSGARYARLVPVTRLHDPSWRGFASDNYAGVHPEVLAAIAEANGGHQVAYGEDVYTARLQEVVKSHFGERAEAFPVFNGTGANVTALTSLLPRWGAVVTSANAHIHTDEGGAPERMTGLKLLPVQTPDGKLTPELIDREAWGWGDEHRAQPLAVSITQTTELGTLYTADEVRAIADHVHAAGMVLHMDGSRLSNAGAALGGRSRDFHVRRGRRHPEPRRHQERAAARRSRRRARTPRHPPGSSTCASSRCSSRRRCGSCRRSCSRCTRATCGCARPATRTRWRRGCGRRSRAIDGLTFTQPTQANAIFVALPPGVADRLREHFRFYDWDPATGEVRWMTAFDTTEADVDAFAAAIRKELTP